MLDTLPLDQLQELRGIAPYYYDWLTHPFDDPWWDWCDLRNKYGRVHAAVLNFSGWYDDNYGPEGATTNFAGLLKSRSGQRLDPQTHLLIGPWVHGVAPRRRQNLESGRLHRRRRLTTTRLSCAGWITTCEADANGVEKEKPVRYFVMGDDQWREADAWPPASKAASYYLISPSTGEGRGSLVGVSTQGKEVVRVFCLRSSQTGGQFLSACRARTTTGTWRTGPMF